MEAHVPRLNADTLLRGDLAQLDGSLPVSVSLGGQMGHFHDAARGGGRGYRGGYQMDQGREGAGEGTRKLKKEGHITEGKFRVREQLPYTPAVAAIAREQANEAHHDADHH